MLGNVARVLCVSVIALYASTATAGVNATVSATKCAAAKRKAAGRKEADRLACVARTIASATPAPFCVQKAELKFERAFGRANLKGPCPGDAATAESLIDVCINDLRAVISGDSQCDAFKLKSAGKVAAAELSCWGRELLRPNTVMLCVAEAFSRLTAAYGKARAGHLLLGHTVRAIPGVPPPGRTAVHPAGRPARTRYRVVEAEGATALVELVPEQGRMHQLRVHLLALGTPLFGDPAYDAARRSGDPAPWLRAVRLSWRNPPGCPSGTVWTWEAPAP